MAAVLVGLAVAGAGGVAVVVSDPAEPQTVQGFVLLLEELEEETGSTEVTMVWIHEHRAALSVAPDGDEEWRTDYRWDGELDRMGRSSAGAEPFDLASVDPSRFAGMCADVRALVDDPGACSLSISRPGPALDKPDDAVGWITAQVENERGQVASISYDLDGDEVHRSVD